MLLSSQTLLEVNGPKDATALQEHLERRLNEQRAQFALRRQDWQQECLQMIVDAEKKKEGDEGYQAAFWSLVRR